MKKLLFILFLLAFVSCDDDIVPELEKMGMDLMNNPEKLMNLKYYYSEFYSDSLIFMKMKDSTYLNEMKNYIIENFINNSSSLNILEVGSSIGYLDSFIKAGYNKKLTPDSIYSFIFIKDNKCLDFMFLKNNNKYYLFYLQKNIFKTH